MRTIFLFFLLQICISCTTTAQQKISPENHAKIHAFDFWLGEWTVYNYGTDSLAGYSHITSVADSMGLEENYTVPGGAYVGTSLNKYNFTKEQWEQYYIDNSGATLHITGGIEEGKMVLQNIQDGPQGKIYNRITWTPLEDGSVRQTWHQRATESEDWNVVFDGHYKPKEK